MRLVGLGVVLFVLVAGATAFAIAVMALSPGSATAQDSTATPTATPTVHCGDSCRATQTAAVFTATPTVLPTDTPTAVPTATDTATVTPTPPAGVPPCTGHDPIVWHALVERDVDGAITCTYNHEHKHDPKKLDYVFGPLPIQEIDYPWHAFNTRTGNPEAHRTFNWHIVEGASCTLGNNTGGAYQIRNARIQYHVGYNGVTLRTHSYWMQAEMCDANNPSYSGILEVGGWLDFGQLVDRAGNFIPVPDQDTLPGYANNNPSNRRIIGTANSGPLFRADETWYATNGQFVLPVPRINVSVGIIKEAFGWIDPLDPLALHLFTAGSPNYPNLNGSFSTAHIVAGGITNLLDLLDGVDDGFANYVGHTDRWGNVVSGCTAAGLDCIPIRLENVKQGSYQYRPDFTGGQPQTDFDVKVGGVSLIIYPN